MQWTVDTKIYKETTNLLNNIEISNCKVYGVSWVTEHIFWNKEKLESIDHTQKALVPLIFNHREGKWHTNKLCSKKKGTHFIFLLYFVSEECQFCFLEKEWKYFQTSWILVRKFGLPTSWVIIYRKCNSYKRNFSYKHIVLI